MKEHCSLATEIYSRVVGYFRPVHDWNKGKRAEFSERKTYVVKEEPTNTQAKTT